MSDEMSDRWQGESVLKLVSAGVGVEEAARRLLEDGAEVEVLTQVEEFLHALDADPSARDRALLLVERTRLLAERGAAGGQRSDRLRADAARARTGGNGSAGTGSAPGAASRLLRHELATPITVARSAMELLAVHDGDPATAKELVEMALRSLRLADRLLGTWDREERLQLGQAELSWAQVELDGLVRECVADAGAVLLGRHEFVVSVEQAVELPADPDAVRQILFNLLSNAAKFSPERSRIEVTVTTAGGHAEVAVCDAGRGISPQDAARIFEAGQRVDHHVPGMGLGLFVARQLAHAHGGELHLADASGGARFVLRLPLSSNGWHESLSRREDATTARDASQRRRDVSQRERDEVADARDAELDQRDEVAAERDAALDSREALAHERDAGLDGATRPDPG